MYTHSFRESESVIGSRSGGGQSVASWDESTRVRLADNGIGSGGASRE